MLGRLLKTLFAVTVTIVPLFIAELQNAYWRWGLIVGLTSVVAATNFFGFFRPDERFEQARKPTLDWLFDHRFSKFIRALKKRERLPFRVTIMKPVGRLWFRRLKMTYTYGMQQSDADYHMSLPKGHGLAWQVIESGQPGWFHRDRPSSSRMGLNDEEIEKTKDVVALLSVPLKKPGSPKVFAVLSIDAIMPEFASVIEQDFQDLINHNHRDLLRLISVVRTFA